MDKFNGRQILSRLIRVNSIDDAKATSKSDFKVNIVNALSSSKVIKVVLKSCSFSHVFYNVNTGNQNFTFLDNAVSKTAVVPVGWYLTSSYMTILKPLIDAQLTSGTVVITQDPYNQRLTFAFTGTAGDVILLPKATNPAGNLVGITANITLNAGNSYTSEVQSVPRFNGLSEVFLSVGSKSIDTSNMADPFSSGTNRNIFTNIPITASFGATNHYRSFDEDLDSIVLNSPIDLDELNIRLETRDATADVLDLQNTNLRLVLKVYYVNR
jgi:hypothetical protein